MGSAFLVYRKPTESSSSNALIIIEIAKTGNGTDIVNVIAAGDRQLRQHEKRSSRWLEGHHTLTTVAESNPAGSDNFSDVQPSGSKSVSQLDKKSNDALDGFVIYEQDEKLFNQEAGDTVLDSAQDSNMQVSGLEKIKLVKELSGIRGSMAGAVSGIAKLKLVKRLGEIRVILGCVVAAFAPALIQ